MFVVLSFPLYSGEIFNVEADARAVALGSAYTSLAQGASAVFWNPASLNSRNELLFNFGLLYEGINYSFVSYSTERNLGVGMYLVLSGDIEFTKLPDTTRPPSSDNLPVVVDRQTYIASAIYISLSRKPLGYTLKVLYQGVGEYQAYGLAWDVGFKYGNLGIVAKDLPPSLLVWHSGERESLAPKLLVDANYTLGRMNIVLGTDLRFDGSYMDRLFQISGFSAGIRLGMEYNVDVASIRVGYRNGKLAFGGGIKFEKYFLDYGAVFQSDIGFTHRINFGIVR